MSLSDAQKRQLAGVVPVQAEFSAEWPTISNQPR